MRDGFIIGCGVGAVKGLYTLGVKIAGEIGSAGVAGVNFYNRMIGKNINVKDLVVNKKDEFVTVGPSQRVITKYMNEIAETGKVAKEIIVKEIGDGKYQIINGHHRVQASINMGIDYIKAKVVK